MLKTKGEPVKDFGRRVTWSGSILEASTKDREMRCMAAHKMDWRRENWKQEYMVL